MVLDPCSITVRFLGALDPESRKAQKSVAALMRLGFEMAIYLECQRRLNSDPLCVGSPIET
ncbi:hypothetical protein [Roseomonas rosulenta]|uniref:hypothetical protein n=1 Tax=Roseomonas rosulenta TaxID=2748667 RepID=UPI001E3FFFC7|nr:hypothetical protein [Roseomonas rosulenta]